ncbi:Y-family DNA polymerase [Vibrio ziniensis]|uniref:DNA polymerase Y family protein n=1 Tax=Vibrio ziniensis TaxID=2711221 RepID=A0A6G7CJQ0_9VIBR|nr:DNA polymerase Y family protein [Vibrio ziniensis]QIH42268.1 DNA polymerase Y family protein [Vibrio ziniensis]
MTLWIYLHFPALQLDTLYAEQERPLVIIDDRDNHVVQASSSALKQGVKMGMGLGSAASMCRELQVHPYDENVETQAIEEVAQWLYLVTSDIVLLPPKGILLRASNMLSLYSGLENYWHTLKNHLALRKTRYWYGSGFSPLSAILVGKSGSNIIIDNKDQILAAINDYPLTATELNIKQIEKLARVGVRDIKALLAVPIQDLARRFDIDLVNYVGKLLGQFKHPVSFYQPPEAFSSHFELLYEIENVQWLEKPLLRLLKRLEQFLTLRNQVAFELELILTQRDNIPNSLYFTSAQGEYSCVKWAKLCQLTLESVQLSQPVLEMTLKVIRAGEMNPDMTDIFDGEKGRTTALELITLLQAKLGQTKVNKPSLSDDPRPEKRCQYISATEPTTATLRSTELRPSLLLPEPEPLCEVVSLIHGPERIVTGWWDNQPITRDYFIAHSEQGRWLWVFRNQDKQWFLHGQFS